MSRPAAQLTTTSYALLGLLAIKPWTTYELAQQMDRSLGRLWPRAQSKIYEEPKKLVARGLARATVETVGKRRRTVYAITAKGRTALREWLALPGAGPALESEQLLRIFFAEHGSKQDALATLRGVRAWADGQRAEHVAVARAYLAGEGPFPQRVPVHTLTGRFLFDFAEMVGRWAAWALEVVEGWPDDPSLAQPDWRVIEEIARAGDATRAAVGRDGRGKGTRRTAQPPGSSRAGRRRV